MHIGKTFLMPLFLPLAPLFFLGCAGAGALPLSTGGSPGYSPLEIQEQEKPQWLDSLEAKAAAWVGTPYLYGGEGPDSIDCSAYVRSVYQDWIALPRRAAWQALEGYEVAQGALMAGDLVFFSESPGSEISHVGLYMGAGRFLNATVSQGVRYSSLDEPYWKERYRLAARLAFPWRESID